MMWATWKKPGKEPLNFNINRKKNWRVISALKDFNNCLKIVKEGLQIPNIIHPSFLNLFYPKNYCQKYYMYLYEW